MRHTGVLVLMLALVFSTFAGTYKPHKGDVIGVDFPPPEPAGSFIKALTGSEITHCGIVAKVKGEYVVIESWGACVMATPLDEFIERCGKAFVVARLNPGTKRRGKIINDAIDTAMKRIGQPYDFAWSLDNDLVYCSELIYEAFGMTRPVEVRCLSYEGWEWFLPYMGLTLDSLVLPPVDVLTAEGWSVVYEQGFPDGWD